MTDRQSFGLYLRDARERSGLTLAAVAESTKIAPCLLRTLEHGDVSRWPGGLYRRSFLRAYAGEVGLPADETLRQFFRLFPEPGQDLAAPAADRPGGLRITPVPDARWRARAALILAAIADGVAVLSLGYTASVLSGGAVWVATAIAAIVYHAVGTIVLGQSPAKRCLAGLSVRLTPAATTVDDLARLRRDRPAEWMESAGARSGHRATT